MVECSQFNPPTTTSMWALSLTDAVYAFLGFGWGKNETKSGILGIVYEKMIMWSQKKYKIRNSFFRAGFD